MDSVLQLLQMPLWQKQDRWQCRVSDAPYSMLRLCSPRIASKKEEQPPDLLVRNKAVVLSNKILSSQAGKLRRSRNLYSLATFLVFQVSLSERILRRKLCWGTDPFGSPLVLVVITVVLAARRPAVSSTL